MELKLVQKLDPNQKIEVHILFPLLEYDFKRLVIQFHDVLVQDSILTQKCDVNQVKISESRLSQKWS